MRNMSARMRRMAYRERDRIAALEAQEAAASQQSAQTEGPGSGDGADAGSADAPGADNGRPTGSM